MAADWLPIEARGKAQEAMDEVGYYQMLDAALDVLSEYVVPVADYKAYMAEVDRLQAYVAEVDRLQAYVAEVDRLQARVYEVFAAERIRPRFECPTTRLSSEVRSD